MLTTFSLSFSTQRGVSGAFFVERERTGEGRKVGLVGREIFGIHSVEQWQPGLGVLKD